MLQQSRVMTIPAILSVRHRAPAAAAAVIPWWLLGGVSAANAIAVYQPKGAADLATSYVNLANPGTYDAAPGTAPTFDAATGWTFNGSSQYLTTGIVPSDLSWSMTVAFSSITLNQTHCLVGAYTSGYFVLYSEKNFNDVLYGNGNVIYPSPYLASGVLSVAGNKGYRNGSIETGTIGAGTIPSVPIYIGCLNANGSPSAYAGATIKAVAIYNATLTETQVGLVSTAMAAL